MLDSGAVETSRCHSSTGIGQFSMSEIAEFATHLPARAPEPVALAIVCDSQNDCGAAVAGDVAEVRVAE
jgi:hypothetical protein